MESTHQILVTNSNPATTALDDPREAVRKKFGRLVTATRKKRGYTSAYSLFHGNGGSKRFGFTYPHFLQIEKGQRLPSIESLKRLLPILLSDGPSEERREMLELYVRASLDGEAIFDIVFRKSGN
jgi:transcriptional regulator with XRE-family HTH domain